LTKNEFSFDRTKSGITDFNANFAAKTIAPITTKPTHKLRILVDKCSVETFLDEGEMAMTNLVFPNIPYSKMELFTKDGSFNINKLEIFEIK
jgi:fructan beta-fructosidase